MKVHLKIEELFQLLLGIWLFSLSPYAWWWFPVLFLLPDLGMLGYLINPKIGAFMYNLLHSKVLAIALIIGGMYFDIDILALLGILLFSHASFDRMLGYGLKYSDSFKHTHLGFIGKK
ncbi:DUF4260 domain-containing protein [Jejudonia soesokkakensis]|uniref:DUF4260 domain-containing protein n=1 Tax=Jejudonia soesokkakensis TaxID=1323432 RepID=A0ABW2MV01_9FLAO